jgi:hypothetical protein
MLHKPGLVKVNRQGVGPAKVAQISVGASVYGTQEIDLGVFRKRTPRRRTSGATRAIRRWSKRSGRSAKGRRGSRCPSERRHRGCRNPKALAPGTPVVSLAHGTAVLAEDLFFQLAIDLRRGIDNRVI